MTSIDCPHCKGPAQVRSSRSVTETYRQLYVRCSNLECGHIFGAELTITHTISPSANPDPNVHLRIGSPRQRKLPVPANDCGSEVPLPLAANDDDGVGEAVATGG